MRTRWQPRLLAGGNRTSRSGAATRPAGYAAAMTLRVVFADDNFLVREGVAALLAESDEVELVDTVGDPHSLVKSVGEHKPDAVLTDIRMPPSHTNEGIEAAKRIRAEHPDV